MGKPRDAYTVRRGASVFTSGEVALICQVAPRTVSKWFDTGLLKGYRIPGSQCRRIPRHHLVEFLTDSGMPVPHWLGIDVAQLLVVSPGNPGPLVAALAALSSDWRIDGACSLFDAAVAAADGRYRAVLLDLALGRSDCVAAAKRLAGVRPPPMMLALACDDEGDALGLLAAFAHVWMGPLPLVAVADALKEILGREE